MSTSIVWPPSLPIGQVRGGFSESFGVLVSRSPMDAGPAKLRKIGNRPNTLNMSFVMSSDNIAILDVFLKTVIMGVKRFMFTHPRTGAPIEVRMIPGSDGEYYTAKRVAVYIWDVDLKLEVLP